LTTAPLPEWIMPRETIEIVLTEEDPYQSGAYFLAVLAYPDPFDEHQRDRFMQSLIRWAILERVSVDPEWAQQRQPVRPVVFTGQDAQHERNLRLGSTLLNKRFAAAQFILMPHLYAASTGRLPTVDGFYPTVKNMAFKTMDLLGWEGNQTSTLMTKVWKPTRPVAHAASAFVYWHEELYEEFGHEPNVDKRLAFLLFPKMVEEVVKVSERFRSLLPQIDQFCICDTETIEFQTHWLAH
jgi:hypothetical protein